MVVVDSTPILIGGYFEGEEDSDDEQEDDECLSLATFTSSTSTWTRTRSPSVHNVEGAAAAGFGAYALLHGGIDSDYDTVNATWKITLTEGTPNVECLACGGEAPHRARHAGAALRDGTTFAVFGGLDADDTTTASLHYLRDTVWTPGPSGPPARYNALLADAPAGLLLCGGAFKEGCDTFSLGDLWVLAGGAWREVVLSGVPKGLVERNGHVGCVLGDVLVVACGAPGAAAGGGESGSYDPRVLLIRPETGVVKAVLPAGNVPVDRYMAAACVWSKDSQSRGLAIATGTKRVPSSNNIFVLFEGNQ